MAKRKELHTSEKLFPDESSSDEEQEIQDIDFEWFDPQPDHDYRGLKILLTQLFDVDADQIDIGALTDLTLSQPLLGSTVKVGGNVSDPCAFLTVLSSKAHSANPAMRSLVDYLIGRLALDPTQRPIIEMLEPSSTEHVGIVLSDRLLNVPPEVAPPMYRMLDEEITWAVEDKEPYSFTHYLVVSKVYKEKAQKTQIGFAEPDAPTQKKAKFSSTLEVQETSEDFHPEDQVAQTSGLARAMQDLGLRPQGHLILCNALDFQTAVKSMNSPD